MWVPGKDDSTETNRDALTFAVGAAGGLLLGLLLSRRGAESPAAGLGTDLRERARAASERARSQVRRLRPARLRRLAHEQLELTDLEDLVIDAFLDDAFLSERAIDVGGISRGIIELSGSVLSEEEARRAVQLANSIEGVTTVVNRLDIESDFSRYDEARRRREEEGPGALLREHSRAGGMGPRRQGRQTDPDRRDDSQHLERRSMEEADRQQWMYEGYAAHSPRTSSRSEVQDPWRTRADEDELSNQDPHGKHADNTLDEQPQDLRSSSRVGEGMKPGIEMELEGADVPVKPHQKAPGRAEQEG